MRLRIHRFYYSITDAREKGRQRSRARDKKDKGDIFLLEKQHENFVAAMTK